MLDLARKNKYWYMVSIIVFPGYLLQKRLAYFRSNSQHELLGNVLNIAERLAYKWCKVG